MPHGGYHGVVKSGGKIIQQGSRPDGQGGQTGGGVYNPQGFATEIDRGPSTTTTQNVEKAIEDKKKEIELLNTLQQGIVNPNIIDQQVDVIDQGFFPTGIMAGSDTLPAGIAPGATFPITGATGIDAINLAKQQQFKNQQLNNLLRQQQEENLRRSILSSAGKGVLSKSDLTGFEGGVLGIRTGDFEDVPAATVINPFTGERIVTGKAREGLSTPEYNEFIQQLYATNPKLFEETFPVASGNLAQPILARLLEGGFMKDAGRLAGNVREGIGSFVDTITGGRFTPTGGTVRPSDGGISNIRFDDFGETVPGSKFIKTVPRDRDLPYIHSGEIPSEFLEGFKKFYQNYEGPIVGGAAITCVTLPDGSVVEFGDTGSARVFREYLESLGIKQPPATGVDAVKDTPQPTGISGFDVDKFYASLPQFQQSYSQQGVSPSLLQFLETAQRFPTV